MKLETKKQVVNLIQEYQDKNYFYTKEAIQTQLNNRDLAISKGQTDAKKYTDEIIAYYVKRSERNRSYNNTFKKMYEAMQQKNLLYLKSVLRYDQKLTKEIFTIITGVKLPNTNKEIATVLETYIK